MKVILSKDIPKIGKKYEVKSVSDGYAANFLFPKNLAFLATPAKISQIEAKRKELEAERKVQADLLSKNIESLKNIRVEIFAKANEKGHLFKGIHKDGILAALKEQKHIDLPDDAFVLDELIKQTGEYTITATIGDATVSFTLAVLKEK